MRALVVVHQGEQRFALPAEATRAVLEPVGLVDLPSPRPGVAGVLRPDRLGLPVLDVLAADGEHVVVLEAAGRRFGVLVGRVAEVVRVPDDALGPPPAGQAEPLVTASAQTIHGAVMVLDPERLAAVLA
ncbi:chemotaxis protein CheW [Conexibacter sp. SYSU D00693]|uniref:chemotaxis protein CheW n=1 Tax=Conexibacter sp. SYSU D00693 TaxID=2812560 RepID=UPI00196A1EA5|nr:chemotaxis protein CheW [Conexibacter sp. SYSU D00693]